MDASTKLNATVTGPVDAQPMVFAHGFGCDQHMWRHVAPAFEDRFRVVLFDYVGCGRVRRHRHTTPTATTRCTATPPTSLDSVRELDLHDVVFVGHSVSSMIGALAVAAEPGPLLQARHGRALAALHRRPGRLRRRLRARPTSTSSSTRCRATTSAGRAPWRRRSWATPDRPELGEELTESFCRMRPGDRPRSSRGSTFLSDNRADLARVTVPTLVLQCRDDVIAPIAVGEYVDRALPSSELVAAGGHRPLPQPERARARRCVRSQRSSTAPWRST